MALLYSNRHQSISSFQWCSPTILVFCLHDFSILRSISLLAGSNAHSSYLSARDWLATSTWRVWVLIRQHFASYLGTYQCRALTQASQTWSSSFSYLRSAPKQICGSRAQLWEPLWRMVPLSSCLGNWVPQTVLQYRQATLVHCTFCVRLLSDSSWTWLRLRPACIYYQARLRSANFSSF